MSFFATVGGSLAYEKQEDFDAALKLLVDGGYCNSEGHFLDDMENALSEELDINKEAKEISIPVFHYKSLAYLLDDVVVGATWGTVVWTSTDGCFQAGVYKFNPGTGKVEETTYELADWIKTQEFSADELDPMPNQEEDFSAWVEWAGEVEQLFFEEML